MTDLLTLTYKLEELIEGVHQLRRWDRFQAMQFTSPKLDLGTIDEDTIRQALRDIRGLEEFTPMVEGERISIFRMRHEWKTRIKNGPHQFPVHLI